MFPKIKVDPGRRKPPIELQKAYDTDLQTNSKTVIDAINEINEKVNGRTLIESVSNEFVISEGDKILKIKAISKDKITGLNEVISELNESNINVNRLVQNEKDILVMNGGDSKN